MMFVISSPVGLVLGIAEGEGGFVLLAAEVTADDSSTGCCLNGGRGGLGESAEDVAGCDESVQETREDEGVGLGGFGEFVDGGLASGCRGMGCAELLVLGLKTRKRGGSREIQWEPLQ